jgi:hypothetical protein
MLLDRGESIAQAPQKLIQKGFDGSKVSVLPFLMKQINR